MIGRSQQEFRVCFAPLYAAAPFLVSLTPTAPPPHTPVRILSCTGRAYRSSAIQRTYGRVRRALGWGSDGNASGQKDGLQGRCFTATGGGTSGTCDGQHAGVHSTRTGIGEVRDLLSIFSKLQSSREILFVWACCVWKRSAIVSYRRTILCVGYCFDLLLLIDTW